ncbi:MAG: hypothetical protein Q9187_006204, partial [Circinaria calcarea]
MAAVIPARSALPQQKLKRPPLPSVQTTINGAKSSQSSPSPSLGSKRPPSGFKHPPAASTVNGANGPINGTASRSSVRRKDPQKPGDMSARQARSAKAGGPAEGLQTDKRATKRMPEPFVRTTSYMLKKFRKASPSLILHLHPTHFRFDQQDGSFSYNSAMKVLLEHIKSQTVPHDMLEDLVHAGVKFYEGCLIIQIQDHRSSSAVSQTSPSTLNRDKNTPFSIHNYNEHLTPSPFVPYPHSTEPASTAKDAASVTQSDVAILETEKENQPSSTSNPPSKGPKIFTTVLFPTPMSLQEEIIAYANTPDNRSNNRKQSQVNGRTPASATFPQPATPLSAVPPTPSASGPPAKKQKMMISGKDIPAFEAKLIAASASPLYLEPVDSLQEAQIVLQALQDPLFQNKPPAPKTRKRTVAELAADEALAAEEQRFMLIMDERLVPSANAAACNTAAADGESGAASFEPRFERFKALEEIKLNHLEKARRDQEMKVLQQQASKAKQEQQEQQARQLNEQKLREAQQQQELARRYQTQKIQLQALQQHQMAASQNPHAHPPTSNGMMNNNTQQVQAHHSSPVPRNLTPHNNSNSSPLVGGVMVSHSGHSMPMTATTSNQGAGSPSRPGSALQHAHPGVAAAMVNQRGQQPPSRNGTPQMPNGTPRLQQPTPVPRHNTPTPRMSQASPVSSAMVSTPVMGAAMMAIPHMTSQHLTPQQQVMIQQRQQQQQQQAAAAAAFANQQHGMQGSPPMNQMSPQNLQQLAAHQAHQQAQANRSNMAHQELYRQQLQTLSHQS